MGPELKLKLSLNCGLEFGWLGVEKVLVVLEDTRGRLLVPLERSEKLYGTF